MTHAEVDIVAAKVTEVFTAEIELHQLCGEILASLRMNQKTLIKNDPVAYRAFDHIIAMWEKQFTAITGSLHVS